MPESSSAATSPRADKRMVPNPSGRGPANRTCRSALECCQQLRQTPAATVQGCSRSRPLTAHLHEGPDDKDAHGDGFGAVKMVAAMMAPYSVKAWGRYLIFWPRFKVTI